MQALFSNKAILPQVLFYQNRKNNIMKYKPRFNGLFSIKNKAFLNKVQ